MAGLNHVLCTSVGDISLFTGSLRWKASCLNPSSAEPACFVSYANQLGASQWNGNYR